MYIEKFYEILLKVENQFYIHVKHLEKSEELKMFRKTRKSTNFYATKLWYLSLRYHCTPLTLLLYHWRLTLNTRCDNGTIATVIECAYYKTILQYDILLYNHAICLIFWFKNRVRVSVIIIYVRMLLRHIVYSHRWRSSHSNCAFDRRI